MLATIRPLLRPIPIVGSLFFTAAVLSTSKMTTSTAQNGWATTSYTPRHKDWPYKPSDFSRQDSSPDNSFYNTPRFVTHIDDMAIESLRAYYDTVLPRKGRILDFCSSWVSHYPKSIEDAARVGDLNITGMGMNKAELAANIVLNRGKILVDLNVDRDIRGALIKEGAIGSGDSEKLDASTNVVSIDYLIDPVTVLHSLREATKAGGSVHLAISNRCFPTKAINRWLRVPEKERLLMVGDFLHFAGWTDIEIVELSDGTIKREGENSYLQSGLQGMLGMDRRDPLWIVRAKKGTQ